MARPDGHVVPVQKLGKIVGVDVLYVKGNNASPFRRVAIDSQFFDIIKFIKGILGDSRFMGWIVSMPISER